MFTKRRATDNCMGGDGGADNLDMASGWTFILHNGGIRSLVATAAVLTETPRPRVGIVYVHDGRPGGPACCRHVHLQAEHFGIRQVHELDLHNAGPTTVAGGPRRADLPLRRPRLILTALAHAEEFHADHLIWPIQVNGDFDQMARISEQLVLVRHLGELEPVAAPALTVAGDSGVNPGASEPGGAVGADLWNLPQIETPYLELTDKQLVELGGQFEVDWWLAWSCQMDSEKPCLMCGGCRRRRAAFDAAGLIDSNER